MTDAISFPIPASFVSADVNGLERAQLFDRCINPKTPKTRQIFFVYCLSGKTKAPITRMSLELFQ